MKMIAGLGNPGAEYAQTKHNVGFMLVDALAERLNAPAWKEDFFSAVTEVRIGGEKVFLVKPLTYMNNSGEAIGPMLSYYKMAADDLTVVHDDMDIPAGTVRIRKKGVWARAPTAPSSLSLHTSVVRTLRESASALADRLQDGRSSITCSRRSLRRMCRRFARQ